MSGVFFYWLTKGHTWCNSGADTDLNNLPWLDHSLPSSSSPTGWFITQSSPESAGLGHAQPLEEVAPGYSVNKANEDANQFTAAPIQSQGGIDAPGSGEVSSSTNLSEKCACIVCLAIGVYDSSNYGPEHCHVATCTWKSFHKGWGTRSGDILKGKDRAAHAKTHYRQGQGPEKSQPFHCLVKDCRYSAKRWSDLRRHTTATHCASPAKYECSVIGCNYHGEGYGFTRKDKLTAHYRSMHNGQRVPGQVSRTLQPAPASSHAQASGSNSIAAQQQ